MSSSALHLAVTPRMRTAFRRLQSHSATEQRAAEEFHQLLAVFREANQATEERPAWISGEMVQALSRRYREMIAEAAPAAAAKTSSTADSTADSASSSSDTADNDDDSDPGEGWVHTLCQRSRIQPLPSSRAARPRDPAFLKFLEEQRWKQERREYHAMVKDLPGNKISPDQQEEGIGSSYASASRDLGHGINILTLMVTGFIVFYYVGSNLFPHNHIWPVLCGLVGLIGALMVEVSLFLVREQKASLEETQHKKILRAQKEQARKWEAEQRRQGRTKEELERRRKNVLQETGQALEQENKLD
jgi:hypothetical protein